MIYFPGLYNVAIVTPPRINRAPTTIYQERAPEKYWGKNQERIKEKATPQKAYVTFKQSAFAAPILSIAVYQQRNEYIPMAAVTARRIQQGA